MRISKKIIALFCSIAMSFSLLHVPVTALSGEEVSATIGVLAFAFDLYKEWAEAHPGEPDSAYPGFNPGGIFGGGAGRKDHFEEDYKNYVSTLPASGYDSTGRMIWHPAGSDVRSFNIAASSTGFANVTSDNYSKKSNSIIYNRASFASYSLYVGFLISFLVPASGEYRVLAGQAFSYSIESNQGSFSDSKEYVTGSFSHYDANSFMPVKTPCLCLVKGDSSAVSVLSYHSEVFFPAFEFVPDSGSGSGSVGDVYNISTRPTSISGGNYGIVGDNGQITKVENNSTIVNETNNTYYNPATGQTQPITNWAYDYSDRSYTLTLDGGKTSTVTYGDEYITIQEGDTVYNVYYVVDGSGTENPPAACTHDWQETNTTPATCTAPGSKLLTCSKCQQTKSETIPALGHDWQVKQTVTTQYDDSGQLTQQGYTIYQCSRCGEQYKSTDGTAPPGGEDDTTIGGLIEKLLSGLGGVLSGIIKGLLSLLTQAVEAISGIGELFTSFVASLVGLWGGFTDFLAAVFPFLPEEFITIVELGLILMIAAAVFKKFAS